MNPRTFPIAAALAAVLLSLPAAAQDNFYATLGAGASSVSADCSGTSHCDKTSAYARLTAGYEFAPQWAVEVSIAHLGRIKAGANVPGVGTVDLDARMRSVGLGIATTLPLNDCLSLTARLGAAHVKTSIDGSVSGVGSASDADSTTAPAAGIALNLALSKTSAVALTLDTTRAEYAGEKATVNALGAALTLRF